MNDAIKREKMEAVAFLRARGKILSEIAAILKVSPAKVETLLKEAEAKGLYKETARFNSARVSATRLNTLRLLDKFEELRDKLRERGKDIADAKRQIFQHLYIYDSGGTGDSHRSIQRRLGRFALESKATMVDFISHAQTLGVAWGATIASLIRALEQSDFKHRRKPIRVVPTCGEPFGAGGNKRADSSSYLSAELALRARGASLSLTGVPVVLPMSFTEAERSTILRFIRLCPAYEQIFNQSNGGPLVEKIETLLTSVAPSDWYWRMCGVELCEIGGIKREDFEGSVLGDLGGVVLPKNDEEAKNAELRRIRSLWTGIGMDHYRTIARNGDSHKGVVVFAIGGTKAKVVFKAICLGLVNHLVCDKALADGLCAEAGISIPGKRKKKG